MTPANTVLRATTVASAGVPNIIEAISDTSIVVTASPRMTTPAVSPTRAATVSACATAASSRCR